MAKRQSHLHGLLVVDKPGLDSPQAVEEYLRAQAQAPDARAPRLPTSHDIVQKVRRWSGQRRIGHTGTLDPMASGVLVLCLGLATRLVEYYQGHDKRYYAEVVLGTATDTYDAVGAVVAAGTPPPLSPAVIEAALERFRGTIQQRPPAYSALKQDGESVHRRARRGETVELPARTVTFHALELVDILAPNRFALRVHCSAGTYIRSLAHDLGAALGAPAHLGRLRRETAGAFSLEQAYTLDAVEAAAQAGNLASLLEPTGAHLHMPALTLDAEAIRRFGFGQTVALPVSPFTAQPPAQSIAQSTAQSTDGDVAARPRCAQDETGAADDLAQAYHVDGRFLGIIRRIETGPTFELWKTEKWLAIAGEGLDSAGPDSADSDSKGIDGEAV